MPDSIEERIEERATEGISSASDETGSVKHDSIDDLIKAGQYVAGKKAAKKPHFGLRRTKLIPPGGG